MFYSFGKMCVKFGKLLHKKKKKERYESRITIVSIIALQVNEYA